MTNHRDSVQQTLTDNQPTMKQVMQMHIDVTTQLAHDHDDMSSHIDRLYNAYHDLWDAVEKLSEGIAQDVPLPLKYK